MSALNLKHLDGQPCRLVVGKFPLESYRNGETPHSTHSLLGTYFHTRTFALASDKEVNWELLINIFILELPIFSP